MKFGSIKKARAAARAFSCPQGVMAAAAVYHPIVPGSPLKGPTMSFVIQPP